VPGDEVPPKLPLKLDVLVPSEPNVPGAPKLPPSLGCSPVGFTGVVVEPKSDNPDVGLALSAVVVTPGAVAVVGAVVDPVVAVVEVPSPPNPPNPPRLNAGLLVVVVVVDSANGPPPSVNAGFTSAGLVVVADKPVALPTLNRLVALEDPRPVAGAVAVVVVTVAAGAVIVCVVVAPRLKPLNPVEMGAFTGVVVEAGVVAAVPRLNPPKPVVDGGLATAAVVAVVADDVSAPKLGVEFEEKPPKPAGFGAVAPAAAVVEAPNKDVVA